MLDFGSWAKQGFAKSGGLFPIPSEGTKVRWSAFSKKIFPNSDTFWYYWDEGWGERYKK